jgi:hypothetical protein
MIDSGASRCIFHSQIGQGIGLSIESGEEEQTTGVDGQTITLYLHRVSLYLMGAIIPIKAGFSDQVPLAGLLGRRGFLEHFKFTFDNSTKPPQFELTRIVRT